MNKANQTYYQYLKEHIKILDVCSLLNIDVRTSGESNMCRCPKHSDEHPSLCIYPNTNTYYCFQCDDTGDVIEFRNSLKKTNSIDEEDYYIYIPKD